jgi:hypothetical protein
MSYVLNIRELIYNTCKAIDGELKDGKRSFRTRISPCKILRYPLAPSNPANQHLASPTRPSWNFSHLSEDSSLNDKVRRKETMRAFGVASKSRAGRWLEVIVMNRGRAYPRGYCVGFAKAS